MTVTTLDPKTALVVIDLQNGIVATPTAHPVDDVIAKARALADAFRGHGLPVVLVTVIGGPDSRTEQPRQSGGSLPEGWADDHIVVKKTWGAFTNTDLEHHLKDLDVTQVVLAGVATSIGVESTARQAHEHGLNVTLALDAMTDRDLDAHIHTTTRIFPRLGETGTTAEIIGLLDQRG